MPALHIRLLGGFEIRHDGKRVDAIYPPRQQSLLAYLLLHRRAPIPRRQIAFILWPETSEKQAHTNLRRELHHLRQLLPEADQFLEVGATILG